MKQRPQWHKDAFPFLDDEDYNRPVSCEEFTRRNNEYMHQFRIRHWTNIAILVGILILVGLAGY